jgi:hypothetical protein
MKKICLSFIFGGFIWASEAQPQAELSRMQIRDAILKSFTSVEKERAKTLREIERSASEIVSLRNKLSGEEESVHAKIVEAHTVADIAEMTAAVEMIKLDAKKRIDMEVDRLEAMKRNNKNGKRYEKEKAAAMRRIAEAIAEVEKTKARATRAILKVTKEAERKKMKPVAYADEEAALRIAESEAKRRIVKAVTSVEIAEAVMKVELCKCLSKEDKRALLAMDTKNIDLDKIKTRAKAAIAEATADMEMAKARALSRIAQAVATVEIAKAIVDLDSDKKVRDVKRPATAIRSHYPKRILRYEKN